jgi:hypothetical protein
MRPKCPLNALVTGGVGSEEKGNNLLPEAIGMHSTYANVQKCQAPV